MKSAEISVYEHASYGTDNVYLVLYCLMVITEMIFFSILIFFFTRSEFWI